MDPDRPLVVLLLPQRLEDFPHRPLAEELLQANGVVAVDPPRLSYARQARWPELFGVLVAQRQAKRLRKRLPGQPVALAIFTPVQYLLARSLLAFDRGCELWYGALDHDHDHNAVSPRLAELHALATERAAMTFGPDGDAMRERLADALEAAGRPPAAER
jgi:hypothetical protein